MRNYVINNKEFRKKHSPLVKLSLIDKIESYEKEQFIDDEEEIVNLRNQLEDLLKVRDQLNKQIEDLTLLINLEASKETGGIKP